MNWVPPPPTIPTLVGELKQESISTSHLIITVNSSVSSLTTIPQSMSINQEIFMVA